MEQTSLSASSLSSRLVRYEDLIPCYNAFVDTRSPGSESKENFTIIGPGVSENPDQHVHIAEPHGFNIGGARQPPRCVNSQHSHQTAEVFVVLSGEWSFNMGETGTDARIRLSPGEAISIPTNMFRGFENVGEDTGFLWAVLGGDDPGRVLWAPYVFEMARNYGLVLLENGSLIDTSKGDSLPPGVKPMHETDAADVARVQRCDDARARASVVKREDLSSLATIDLAPGVIEAAVIGPANMAEGLGMGRLGWEHGFHLRRLSFESRSALPLYRRREAEVLFVQHGTLAVSTAQEQIHMGPGDTLTVPVGQVHSLASEDGAVVFVVRGGDHPAAAVPEPKVAQHFA